MTNCDILEENGPIYQIAKSATDPVFAESIEYHGEPVLVVIEGLTMYLSEADVSLPGIHTCFKSYCTVM